MALLEMIQPHTSLADQTIGEALIALEKAKPERQTLTEAPCGDSSGEGSATDWLSYESSMTMGWALSSSSDEQP